MYQYDIPFCAEMTRKERAYELFRSRFGNCKAYPSPAPSGFCYAKPTSLPEGGCGKSRFFASAGRGCLYSEHIPSWVILSGAAAAKDLETFF